MMSCFGGFSRSVGVMCYLESVNGRASETKEMEQQRKKAAARDARMRARAPSCSLAVRFLCRNGFHFAPPSPELRTRTLRTADDAYY